MAKIKESQYEKAYILENLASWSIQRNIIKVSTLKQAKNISKQERKTILEVEKLGRLIRKYKK